MAEQTFRSPGFFEREIDLSQREQEIIGTPGGVIGTAEMGPAFVPVTVGSFSDFSARFGELDSTRFGPYAVNEFLKHRTALTYVRVLGAGANETSTDIENTRTYGTVKNAGFQVVGRAPTGAGVGQGGVHFLCARHHVSASLEAVGYPIFSDNDSYALASNVANLVRGVLFLATGTFAHVLDYNENFPKWGLYYGRDGTDLCTIGPNADPYMKGKFKFILSSSTSGANFGNDQGIAGVRILTASLDPANKSYIANILNTDPGRFQIDEHLLYLDFAVENEVATVSTLTSSVGLVSGSLATDSKSSVAYRDIYGRYDTRYSPSTTPSIISQPFGNKEYDLFSFETISDGGASSDKYKISISNIQRSINPQSEYGTFTVEVRKFDDTDTNKQTVEQYPLCTLDPNDDDFVARKIGDFKVVFDFDAEDKGERRLSLSGKYPNISSRVRIKMSTPFEEGNVPKSALPFGFKGIPVLKTTTGITDSEVGTNLLWCSGSVNTNDVLVTSRTSLTSSIVPPLPFTFKTTRGAVNTSPSIAAGSPGDDEIADSRYYWGTKVTTLPQTSSLAKAIFNSNASSKINELVRSYTKFMGISKMGGLLTGTLVNDVNDNKFTLSRVALFNTLGGKTLNNAVGAEITGSQNEHMLEACYLRNGNPDATNYTITDGVRADRLTLASLLAVTSSVYFNKFADYNKFTTLFYGGFDGNNILNADMRKMDDRASSADTGGLAVADPNVGLYAYGGTTAWNAGLADKNNTVASYRAASEIILDPMQTRINLLAIPGQRDSYVTDYVLGLTSDYAQALYLLDLAAYTDDGTRVFDNDTNINKVDVTKTSENFDGRAVNNNYAATYFPDISINDDENGRPVRVPSSVAAMAAIGFNDSIAYPWFAPAGFNRAALDFVVNTAARLNKDDRNKLYDARINPIASFPNAGFVIFGQKTLQQAKSALDRVNVRRMLLEVKRVVGKVANKIVFEQNNAETRARFVSQVTPLLALIQSQQGVDQFKIVCDSSNNSDEDVESNRLNGRIVVVPTRAVEFIAIDFIITTSGVIFV